MTLTLNKIRSFLSVVEFGGIGLAAEERALSQPALSKHIQDLEAFLGIPLLHRTTRGMKVTPEGRVFYNRMRRSVEDIDTIIVDIKEEAALQRGKLTISSIPTVAGKILPPAITEFREKFPGIEIIIIDEASGDLEQHILSHEADFGIGPNPERSNNILFEPLMMDYFYVAFPENHWLANENKVSLGQLVDEDIITIVAGNVRLVISNAFASIGHKFVPSQLSTYHYTIGRLVESGLGITIMPLMTLSMMLNDNFNKIKLSEPEISREIGIMTRRGSKLTPAASTFLTILKKKLELD